MTLVRQTALFLTLFLLGCSTPEARIRKHPELFASFPPEIQSRVQAGEVDIGFSRDMVYLALGRPDRIYERRTLEANTTIWSYTARDRHLDSELVRARFLVPDGRGGSRYVTESTWVDVENYTEYDALRLEFIDDAVTAIERIQPPQSGVP